MSVSSSDGLCSGEDASLPQGLGEDGRVDKMAKVEVGMEVGGGILGDDCFGECRIGNATNAGSGWIASEIIVGTL